MTVLAYTLKPVYRGLAVLAPVSASRDPLGGGLDTSAGAIGAIAQLATAAVPDIDRDTDEAMTVLRSREFTENFIRDNNLLPVLFPKLWDARAARWKDGIKKMPTLHQGYVALDRIRKIDLDSINDFVTLQIDWRDRTQAAEWVNNMGERLNDELRKRAIASADVSLEYLQKELGNTTDVEAREAISRLMESQIKKKMLAHVTQEFEIRFIDKALPADPDLPQRPNKLLMISVGLAFGILLGIAVTLLLYRRDLASKGLL
jgi:hypothetical protein